MGYDTSSKYEIFYNLIFSNIQPYSLSFGVLLLEFTFLVRYYLTFNSIV